MVKVVDRPRWIGGGILDAEPGKSRCNRGFNC